MVAGVGAALFVAGFVVLITGAFYDVYATMVYGSICTIVLAVYLLKEDLAEAAAGGVVGWLIFFVTAMISPTLCIILGAVFLVASRAL